jgi:2'-5' RNA ligase
MEPAYSLWILPDAKTQEVLQRIVEKLAAEFGGPTFETHLTLVSNIHESRDIIREKTKEIAISLKPFPLELERVEFSSTYFQNVFVRANATAALMNAFATARTTFGIDARQVFMPHISLLYGNHSMETREKAMQSIQFPKISFMANTLCITPSVPDPAGWEHIEEITF